MKIWGKLMTENKDHVRVIPAHDYLAGDRIIPLQKNGLPDASSFAKDMEVIATYNNVLWVMFRIGENEHFLTYGSHEVCRA